AVSLRLQSVSSQAAMADAMKGVTRAMVRMNRQINLPGLQNIMMEFERQSQIMDMKQEIIDDTSTFLFATVTNFLVEDMWDDEGEQEETDEIVNQVLDEIGINMNKDVSISPDSLDADLLVGVYSCHQNCVQSRTKRSSATSYG